MKQRAEANADAQLELWKQIYDRIHAQVYQAWFPEAQGRPAYHNYILNYRSHGWMGNYTCYSSDQGRAMWLSEDAPIR